MPWLLFLSCPAAPIRPILDSVGFASPLIPPGARKLEGLLLADILFLKLLTPAAGVSPLLDEICWDWRLAVRGVPLEGGATVFRLPGVLFPRDIGAGAGAEGPSLLRVAPLLDELLLLGRLLLLLLLLLLCPFPLPLEYPFWELDILSSLCD